MRVLIFNYEYPPLGGGAGVATRYLLGAFARRTDLEIDLVTSSMDRDRLVYHAPQIRIHFMDIGKNGSLHFQSQAHLSTYAARSLFHARRLMRQQRFDLVHAFFGVPSGPVARALGLPYIVSLRGSDVPFYSKRFETLDRLFFKRLSRSVWRRAAFVVANSAGLRELALDSAPSQAIEVIHNGVDTRFFRPPERRPANERLILVSTGRLIERKGYDRLIAALAGLDQVALRLIGDGTQRARLEALAAHHRVPVSFLGPLPREGVARELQAADLFALPSLNEGMSNSLLEAMASGLPALVTDVGGSSELIDGNGFIVSQGDGLGLRRAIETYLENPDLLIVHGERSRELALTMSVESMADKYLTLYGRAVDRPAGLNRGSRDTSGTA